MSFPFPTFDNSSFAIILFSFIRWRNEPKWTKPSCPWSCEAAVLSKQKRKKLQKLKRLKSICWPLLIGSWRCFVTFTSLLLWGDSYDIRVTSARSKSYLVLKSTNKKNMVLSRVVSTWCWWFCYSLEPYSVYGLFTLQKSLYKVETWGKIAKFSGQTHTSQ